MLDVDKTEALFIYGTLLPGLRLADAMAGASCLGEAVVPGLLYDVGPYPGLVEGKGLVHGLVYRLSPQHLDRLDGIEEMVPGDRLASLYWRIRIEVMAGACAPSRVWTYRYNRSVSGLRCIPGGDYRQHLNRAPSSCI